jgi:PDZ domain-containing protein
MRRAVTPGRLLALGVILLAVLFVLWVYPSNEYIFLPDRAHPVAPLVTVAGSNAAPDGGGIYYVDVIVRKATLLEQLLGGLHNGADLESPAAVVAPGVSSAELQAVNLREMAQSKQIAAAVALRASGLKVTTTPIGALITDIIPGTPAVGRLEPTDVILAIDGTPVRSTAALRAAMTTKRVGQRITVTVLRGRETKQIHLTTGSPGAGSKRAIIGVALSDFPAEKVQLPLKVTIDSGNVGGPSAGLAFALDLMEKLGRNVDGGRRIAATGEIFPNGAVGPIGGIKQKTIGAREAHVDAFLVPAGENYRDALKYAHGLRIIPVTSFQQALRALATLSAKG